MGSFDVVFFDGGCGFCHGWVRFTIARDRSGERFRFAPLVSAAFHASPAAARFEGTPETLVVLTPTGEVLTESLAVLRILERLGGGWARLGRVLRVVPQPIRDAGYRLVARVRRRLAPPPPAACPIVPVEARGRFLS